jgi:pimeloyl-ACP methyl ester carboxylesterase
MKQVAGLEYEERGDGEVIYLVHAGVHSAWFGPLFADAGLTGFRVIRVVRPGYGGSEVPAGHLSPTSDPPWRRPPAETSRARSTRSCGA